MPLLSILLVPKTGEVQQTFIKEFSETDLFKRAGFKSATDFEKRTVYRPTGVGEKQIHVYGKVTGRAGQENKYELPPPIAETLFFGTVVLVAKLGDAPVSLTVQEWQTMYDGLMGGFEDIGSEDTAEEEEEDATKIEEDEEEVVLTQDGYVKDGFVVDDDDEDASVSKKKKLKKPLVRKVRIGKTTAPKKKMTTDQVVASAVRAMTNTSVSDGMTTTDRTTTVLDCANELTEEEYM